MTGYDYDLFTIGAGSGGVRASRIAAQHGARVAVAEEFRVGGTCVIRGCVPKKLLVYASRFGEEFADSVGFGWTPGEAAFDWPTLIANKDREIDRLNGLYIANLDKAGVEIIEDRAVVKDPHTVRLVTQERDVTARTILIATGATPNIDAGIPGIEHAITSNDVFHLPELPRRIAIAGAGYIAVEFAGIFNGLGVETTLVYRRDRILRGFDEDLRIGLQEEMEKKGVNFVLGQVFTGIEKTGTGLRAGLSGGGTIEADQILFAIGRDPNTRGLGLEEAGVALGERGAVIVDAYSRTNVDSIYAVGDVTDRVALTPVAIREGHAFADTVFGGQDIKVDHACIPTAVFSQPELGTVGLTEEEARKTRKVKVFKTRFRPMRHTLSGNDERMLMKLVVDEETDRVLGCHLLGPDSGELIQVLGIAVRMGATKADFDGTMAVHPTVAEELVTLR